MSTRQWPTFKEPNATKVQLIPWRGGDRCRDRQVRNCGEGRCQVDLWQKLPFGPDDKNPRREILSPVKKPQFSAWASLSKIANGPPALVTDPLITAVTTQKLRRTLFCKCRKDIWGLGGLGAEAEAGASEKSFSHSCYPAYRREGSLRSEISPFGRYVL
jgi:hypothetical protein